jgi:small subunit ribosomal protein S25e
MKLKTIQEYAGERKDELSSKLYKLENKSCCGDNSTMGGKKKLSLKQMERTQAKKDEPKKKEKAAVARKDKKAPRIIPPKFKDEKTVGELRKLRVLTPYTVASRFDLRLSTAKDFLEQLEERGIVQLVSRSRNIKIYKAVD